MKQPTLNDLAKDLVDKINNSQISHTYFPDPFDKINPNPFDRIHIDPWETGVTYKIGQDFGYDVLVSEDGNTEKIRIPVPGFNENELDISIQHGQVIVRGEKEEVDEEGFQIVKRRNKKSFKEKFSIQDDMIVKEANLKNGILEIVTQKVEENSKKININVR